MVAGGIGIAPFPAVAERFGDHPLELFLGARSADDLPESGRRMDDIGSLGEGRDGRLFGEPPRWPLGHSSAPSDRNTAFQREVLATSVRRYWTPGKR